MSFVLSAETLIPVALIRASSFCDSDQFLRGGEGRFFAAVCILTYIVSGTFTSPQGQRLIGCVESPPSIRSHAARFFGPDLSALA